jgi:phosphatidylglycerol---prolipoprotein diacylglyceryl transferase
MEFTDQYILLPGTFLGDIQIRYYGIIIITAMLLAALVAARLARRNGYDADHIWGGLTWAILPGLLLARLWFVLFPPVSLTAPCFDPNLSDPCRDAAWFLANFFNPNGGAIAIWTGGLSIFGAVLGGLLGAYLYVSRWHNTVARVFHYIFLPISIVFAVIFWLPTYAYQRFATNDAPQKFQVPRFESAFPDDGMPALPWLDIAAIALPLAQAIGRWANFVNQELYGVPTDLPWGLQIPAAARVGEFASMIDYPIETGFHPLFLYESLWSLGAFFVLYWLYTRRDDLFRAGDFFLVYVAQYSVIRFLLEFLRIEKAFIGDTMINSSQVFTVITFVAAIALLLYRRTLPERETAMPPVAYNARVAEKREP